MKYQQNSQIRHFLQALILAIVVAIYFEWPFFDVFLAAVVASIGTEFLGYSFGVGSARATIAETEEYGQTYAADLPDNVVELPHD